MESNKILLALTLKYKGDWCKIYNAIANKENLSDSEIEELTSSFKGNYITIMDKEYPESLKQSYRPPFVLFYKGDLSLLKDISKNVAVGYSKYYVLEHEGQVLEQVLDNDNNVVYVLGDSACTASVLICSGNNNKTIGVLPYPLSYAKYEYDLVLSEYPEGSELVANHYPERYRIMVGISSKTLIVACAKHSGTDILAMTTLSANHDLLVIPTSVSEKELRNNQFIAEGAFVVYDKESFLYNVKGGY